MSYNYLTQYNSPNYTPAAQAKATWGRARTVEAIAIHWWGDPATNPSFEGVVATLVNPARGASAHYVATGTGRRVACLVSPADASWATNSANPYTISIECDPRCREEDYDVVAELIANIRSAYGNIPLVPHRQFVATACPGNWNLGELDRRANLKDGSGDWGVVVDKVTAPPPPPPVTEAAREVFDPVRKFKFNKDARLYNILEYTPADTKVYPANSEVEFKQKLILTNGNQWYRTAYSSDKNIAKGFRAEDVNEVVAPLPPEPTPTPIPEPTPEKTTDQKQDDRIGNTEARLNAIEKIVEAIVSFLSGIFKNFKS